MIQSEPESRSGSSVKLNEAVDPDSNIDLVNCRICDRHFTADRVAKHELVCVKLKKLKRKPFDMTKKRVPEAYNLLLIDHNNKAPQPINWREKHEDFIKTIRAAKQVTLHIKNGGKLEDLPIQEPMSTLGYVQCPHCLRKFNESASQRHIPICANLAAKNQKPLSKSKKIENSMYKPNTAKPVHKSKT